MNTPESDTNEITFVLKAYEECWEQARHIDEFMERMPRFFIVVAGSVIAGVTALIQFSKVTDVTFTFVGSGLVVLALLGLFSSLTIPRYRIIRNSYFNTIYSLNKYFVDRNETLGKYFNYPMQVGGEFKSYYILGIDFYRFMVMAIINTAIFSMGLYSVGHSPMLKQLFTEENVAFSISMSWQEILGSCVFFLINVGFYYLAIRYYRRKS